jgi:HPt (histidine-containing phosphotransfer) domain-containing protein
MEMDLAFGQRMHKLKGMAGMIGADVIEQLASRAEAACKSCNRQEGPSIGRQLSVELQRLRQGATRVLASASFSAHDSMSAMKGDAIEGEMHAKLVDMLTEHDLAAVDLFNSLAPALRRHLGRQSFEAVRDLVDQLRLSEAAGALGGTDRDVYHCGA